MGRLALTLLLAPVTPAIALVPPLPPLPHSACPFALCHFQNCHPDDMKFALTTHSHPQEHCVCLPTPPATVSPSPFTTSPSYFAACQLCSCFRSFFCRVFSCFVFFIFFLRLCDDIGILCSSAANIAETIGTRLFSSIVRVCVCVCLLPFSS